MELATHNIKQLHANELNCFYTNEQRNKMDTEIQNLIDDSIQYTSIYDLIMTSQHSGFMHDRLKKAQEFITLKHTALKEQIKKHPDQEEVVRLLGERAKEVLS